MWYSQARCSKFCKLYEFSREVCTQHKLQCLDEFQPERNRPVDTYRPFFYFKKINCSTSFVRVIKNLNDNVATKLTSDFALWQISFNVGARSNITTRKKQCKVSRKKNYMINLFQFYQLCVDIEVSSLQFRHLFQKDTKSTTPSSVKILIAYINVSLIYSNVLQLPIFNLLNL